MPFQKGHKLSRGRPPGSLNTQSRYLNDLYLLVAEELGEPERNPNYRAPSRRRTGEDDGLSTTVQEIQEYWKWDGKDGVKGYLKWIAKEHPHLFMAGLTKILPNNIVITDNRREILDEIDLEIELRKRGLPLTTMAELIDVTPKLLEQAKENAESYADSATLRRPSKTKAK